VENGRADDYLGKPSRQDEGIDGLLLLRINARRVQALSTGGIHGSIQVPSVEKLRN